MMLSFKRVVLHGGATAKAALEYNHGYSPFLVFKERALVFNVEVNNRSMLFRTLSKEQEHESSEQISKQEDDPGTKVDEFVPTPSLKKEINTRDMFVAKAKETEERLSHSNSDEHAKPKDQQAWPSKDRTGASTGSSYST